MIKVLYQCPRTTHCVCVIQYYAGISKYFTVGDRVRVVLYYADTVSAYYSTTRTPCPLTGYYSTTRTRHFRENLRIIKIFRKTV